MDLATIQKYQDIVVENIIGYAPKVATALLVLIIGMWLAGGVTKLIRRALEARKVDPTLTPFISNLVSWMLKAVVVISVASTLGVQTTSFVAVLGAAGLAVGLALQGSLSNFAGGVLILIFRPYKVGDLIEAQGEIGIVDEIQIFTTIMTSPENRRVIVPNGALSNGTIRNYSAEDVVRVDTTVGVAYDADLATVKKVLTEMITKVPGVVQDPAPYFVDSLWLPGEGLQLTLLGIPGMEYQLLGSPDLIDPQPLGPPLMALDGPLIIPPDPSIAGPQFFWQAMTLPQRGAQ